MSAANIIDDKSENSGNTYTTTSTVSNSNAINKTENSKEIIAESNNCTEFKLTKEQDNTEMSINKDNTENEQSNNTKNIPNNTNTAEEQLLSQQTPNEDNNQINSKDSTSTTDSSNNNTTNDITSRINSIKKDQIRVKNLGYPLGYLLTIYAFIAFSTGLLLIWQYGFIGFWITYFARLLAFWIDENTSNSTELNKKVLNKNGYDADQVFRSAHIKGLIRGLINYPIFRYFLSDVVVYYDGYLVLKVVFALFLTEIYFTLIHKYMHNYHPEMHKKHHCCIYPSLTSNLVFDDLDLFLEFNVPMLVVFLTCKFILEDSFAGMIAVSLIQSIYVVSHDEYLRHHHWYHHKYIDSKYNAYIDRAEFDDNDKIKGIVRRL